MLDYTAHSFFTKHRSGIFARPHTFLASSCVAYLSAFDFVQQTSLVRVGHKLSKFLDSQPLLHYAYRSWGLHSKACYGEGRLPTVVSTFVAHVDKYPLIISDYGFDFLKPCHIAAYYDLPDLLPVANELCNQVTEIFQLTPLILASSNGHRATVQELLCRSDVDINSQDKRCRTALLAASLKGHEAIVKLLLSRTDVAINAITIKSPKRLFTRFELAGQTALLAASRHGYEGIVRLFFPETISTSIYKMRMVKHHSLRLPTTAMKQLSDFFFPERMSLSTPLPLSNRHIIVALLDRRPS